MLFQGEKLTKIYNFYLIFILVLLSVMCLADSAFGLPRIGKSRSEAFILFYFMGRSHWDQAVKISVDLVWTVNVTLIQ